MPYTGLEGPYALTADTIDRLVARNSVGAYALGPNDGQGNLTVYRVGRSDTDLNRRLKDYIGQYPAFKAGYYQSTKAAFDKECHLFHDFSPPDNPMHPDRPNGSKWLCPRCLVFG